MNRLTYEASGDPEKFIVPLLRNQVEEVVARYSKPKSTNPHVLDVGCGRQPFREKLEEIGYIYKSLDVKQNLEKSVDIIWQIDKLLPENLIPFASFEFIFCTEVLEHVADWDIAFNNFSKLLEVGGRLFITCPHLYMLHEEPYDFWRPTPYALKYFADRYGFKVLYEVKAGNGWDVIGTVLASCYCSPVSRNILARLLNQIIAKTRRLSILLIASKILQNHVNFDSSLYLSNIIMFEKL
ncbi:class I SAM-dependent methyltransferase [Pseudanabaena sp. FACHB-1998]|uniref:class I SAM-dependent methyltransferase n=1 Tax=Pseudanabaena sp. FACHB-1998 TaxID=2692858 RepID=UPI001681076A|nr:class I SAM-dependent methyltransferase [Pseudanabaena sp. FACHB-1998]